MIPGISQRAAPDKAKLKKWMLLHFPGREMRGVAAEAGATLTNNARQLRQEAKGQKTHFSQQTLHLYGAVSS